MLVKKSGFYLLAVSSFLLCMNTAIAAPKKAYSPAVDVAEVLVEPVIEWDYFTGRLAAPEVVDLRPRVSGFINAVNFKEGSLVKKGDVLFVIDPRPFQAEVNRLLADLESAKASLGYAKNDLIRARSLEKRHAISSEQVDNKVLAEQQAMAKVAAVQANLDSAKLNLAFTKVTAPISGRISTANITAGNLVTQGQTLLTTIVSTDEMYAYFMADEHSYLDYKRSHEDQKMQNPPITLMGLANQTGYPYFGKMDFIDNQVDPSTGTIRARAIFKNPDNLFTPGLFARIKVATSTPVKSILIDDKAIGTDLSNKYVLVLGDGNKLAYRRIVEGPLVHGLRVIKSGLNAGDKIVTLGLQRVHPGSTVAPKLVPMANQSSINAIQKDAALVSNSLTSASQ
jgi:multidrug efflux system membrane fusion protein